jgi:hypothetical protein
MARSFTPIILAVRDRPSLRDARHHASGRLSRSAPLRRVPVRARPGPARRSHRLARRRAATSGDPADRAAWNGLSRSRTLAPRTVALTTSWFHQPRQRALIALASRWRIGRPDPPPDAVRTGASAGVHADGADHEQSRMAEELTVDVFHDVWRRASTYDPAGGSVVGWIINQARSRAIDRLRFEQRKKRVNRDVEGPPATPTASDPQEILDVREQARIAAISLGRAQQRGIRPSPVCRARLPARYPSGTTARDLEGKVEALDVEE